jgi:sugar-specific transcriptional regulator TrmB
LELIKNPGKTAGQIAKIVSIDRSFLYAIIDSLIKKGLAYYSFKEGKKVFYASEPQSILKELDLKRSKVINVIESLKQLTEKVKETPNLKIFEGKSGLKEYFEEVLKADEVLTFGGGGNLNLLKLLKFEHPHYFKRAKKKKLNGKIICSDKNKRTWEKMFAGSNVEIRSFRGPGEENSITILKDKIILSSEGETPLVIFICSRGFANSLRYYFEEVWKLAKK